MSCSVFNNNNINNSYFIDPLGEFLCGQAASLRRQGSGY